MTRTLRRQNRPVPGRKLAICHNQRCQHKADSCRQAQYALMFEHISFCLLFRQNLFFFPCVDGASNPVAFKHQQAIDSDIQALGPFQCNKHPAPDIVYICLIDFVPYIINAWFVSRTVRSDRSKICPRRVCSSGRLTLHLYASRTRLKPVGVIVKVMLQNNLK